jgi:hypothetical protein
MRRDGGVNAAGHQACSLPRSATPSVLFAPPQQQATTMALAPQQRFFPFALCAPPFLIHTRTPCSSSQQRSSRSIKRFAASQSSTVIATIDYHSATPNDDRHTIERHAVQQQQSTKNDRTPRSAVFCNNATTIIMIECHAALQCNNQQCLSQRQPSQRRRQRQSSQQQTATLLPQ